MDQAEKLARYLKARDYNDLSPEVRQNVKLHLLDSLGCAIGAPSGEPVLKLRAQIEDFGGKPISAMIGGGKTSPDRAAMYNTALIRYLDFMDNFLATGETCHPCDNIGSLLTAGEYANAGGKELITAIALAYHVECKITHVAPIMDTGFDHTTQLSFSIASGISKLLDLSIPQIVNAMGVSGAGANSLAVIRAEPVSQWKGLASSNSAFISMHNTFLAMRGITGPKHVFEGEGGLEKVFGKEIRINWEKEDCDLINKTLIKRYNAEVHTQSCLEGVEELMQENEIVLDNIEEIEISIFEIAYNIVGGGKYGAKDYSMVKEQADHNLKYLVAVLLLDGQVWPEQFDTERIQRSDVQDLMQRVKISKSKAYTKRYPEEMCCSIKMKMKEGKTLRKKKTDYYGFWKRPMSWDDVKNKFYRLGNKVNDKKTLGEIVQMVGSLEHVPVKEFMQKLNNIRVQDGVYAPLPPKEAEVTY